MGGFVQKCSEKLWVYLGQKQINKLKIVVWFIALVLSFKLIKNIKVKTLKAINHITRPSFGSSFSVTVYAKKRINVAIKLIPQMAALYAQKYQRLVRGFLSFVQRWLSYQIRFSSRFSVLKISLFLSVIG